MPANTAKGYPYPLGTDRLMDGDNVIHDLATAVDMRVGLVASGQVVTAVPAALNTPVSVAVTFPVGLFTVAPSVVVTPGGGAPQTIAASWSAPTTAGVTVWGVRTSGALTAITLGFLASQTGT